MFCYYVTLQIQWEETASYNNRQLWSMKTFFLIVNIKTNRIHKSIKTNICQIWLLNNWKKLSSNSESYIDKKNTVWTPKTSLLFWQFGSYRNLNFALTKKKKKEKNSDSPRLLCNHKRCGMYTVFDILNNLTNRYIWDTHTQYIHIYYIDTYFTMMGNGLFNSVILPFPNLTTKK